MTITETSKHRHNKKFLKTRLLGRIELCYLILSLPEIAATVPSDYRPRRQ